MISIDQLKKLQVFKGRQDSSLEKLARAFDEVSFNIGDVILTEGGIGDALYLIVSGSVRVQVKIDAAGERARAVGILGKEEFFGEVSFFGNAPLSATVIAAEPMTAYVLKRGSLEQALKDDHTMAMESMLTILSGTFSKLSRTTRELVTVFEVARIMAQETNLPIAMSAVLEHLYQAFPSKFSSAFYRWNMFNEEYDRVAELKGEGSPDFDKVLDLNHPFVKSTSDTSTLIENTFGDRPGAGPLIVAPVRWSGTREGLFLYRLPDGSFDAGARQIIDAISSVVAPSLASARHKEEDEAKRLFDERRTQEMSL